MQKRGMRHPAADFHHPSFNSFLPFVEVEDPNERDLYLAVMNALYVATNEMWRPGSCQATDRLFLKAEQLRLSGRLGRTTIERMAYLGCHFYLNLTLVPDQEAKIFDPTGVRTVPEREYMHDRGLITPFFGDVELAPTTHQRVYQKAIPCEGATICFIP